MYAPTPGTVAFPHGAFRVWGGENVVVQVPDGAGSKRTLTVNASHGSDGFTGVAAEALTCKDLKRLERCSQLGPKGIFLREKTPHNHNRLEHSAEAALIAMIWFEALAPQAARSGTPSWAASSDARLALEMAVLFHDARHLPFSHMMEEVFRELNWAEVPALECPGVAALSEAVKGTSGGQAQPKEWWAKAEAVQRGASGVPWLEAIVDSALDADKIAYVFNDSSLTGQGVRLAGIRPWIEEFVGGQSLTKEGLIRLEGGACEATLALFATL